MNLTSKQMLKTLVLVISIFVGLVIFQNCAPPKSQSVEQSSMDGLVAANAFSAGSCGPMINTCSSGSFSNIADSATHSWWRCNGSGGGTSTSCSLPLTSSGPINGVCTNNYNFCLQGDLLDVADTSTHYVWNCRGINSGNTAVCRILKPTDPNAISGQCGVNRNTCIRGVFLDTSDTATDFRWECHGTSGGVNASCSQSISTAPISGACSAVSESCTSGDFEDSPDTNINFVWTCRGRNGGNTNTCFIPKPTCTLSGSSELFFGQNNVYTVRAATGSLPSQIEVRYYGTKSLMNGSGTVIDANGEQINTRVISSNASMTFSYQEPSEAGVYTRYAKIFVPGTQKELCQTNTLNQNLFPLCSLSVNRTTGNLSEEFNFSAAFPATNHRELAASPSSVVWTSTRTVNGNTVPDELNGMQTSASAFPMRYIAGTTNTAVIGLYNRSFVARDSNNRVLCKSNSITYEITAMPAPPPAPTPTPTPTPTPSPTPTPTPTPTPLPDTTNPGMQPPTQPIDYYDPYMGGGGGGGGGGFNQRNFLN